MSDFILHVDSNLKPRFSIVVFFENQLTPFFPSGSDDLYSINSSTRSVFKKALTNLGPASTRTEQ